MYINNSTYMYFHRLGENNIILKCRLSIYKGASQNLSSTRYSCFTRKCPVTLMNDDGKKIVEFKSLLGEY